MRKIITFLGRRPQETHYLFAGQIYTGRVFAEALRQFAAYDEMLVFVTAEAQAEAWPVLAALNDPRIRAVPIPRGETVAEMWEMFDAITSQVNEDETVIFDITHGLRSLPFLVFLFAAYLKTAKRVVIEAIYYGALELGDKSGKPAPVIDLSEFVAMLDWLTATDQFVQTGDARRLARLLNPQSQTQGVLADASQALSNVSLAAFLCQPFTLMGQAGALEGKLLKAKAALQQIARPFDVLHGQIIETFGTFGARFEQDLAAGLRTEFRLVEWYYDNNQLIQAITLAREWLIDAMAYRLEHRVDLKREEREQMEKAISGIAMVGREVSDRPTGGQRRFGVSDLNTYGRTIYTTWPEVDALKTLWNTLSSIRNTLDHAEHQDGAMKLDKITRKADNDVMPELRRLAQKWGLA